MEIATLGALKAVVVGPTLAEEAEKTVVLLHGYGAPGTDLVGLAAQIPAQGATRFVFPQAPQTIEGMSGPDAGRAWWHIDMMALQVARMTGQDDQLAAQVPDGLTEAREALSGAMLALEANGVSPERTILGGFSQGAMLSCDWSLRSEKSLAGLVQLSGTVICESEWNSLLLKRAGLRVFQSHSPDDQVLPFRLAERLQGMMKSAGLRHEFVSFRGGHGIGPEVVHGLSAFIAG